MSSSCSPPAADLRRAAMGSSQMGPLGTQGELKMLGKQRDPPRSSLCSLFILCVHLFGDTWNGLTIFHSGQSDYCHRHIGYNPLRLIRGVDSQVDNGSVGRNTASGLTRVMVLHPVGAVLSFVAFLLAVLGTHVISSFVASLLSGLTFIVVVVALACDFTALSIVHHRVNEVRGNHATYGSALWCVVAALVTSFFATVIVFLSCCASKRNKNKPDAAHKQEAGFADSTVPKKKFWQRR